MKYIKLISFFIFVLTFSSLFAVDLLEQDNSVYVPELEPLKIDLQGIKKKSTIRQNDTVTEKKKQDVKPAITKTSKSAGVKKTGSKIIKSKKKKKPAPVIVKKTAKNVKIKKKPPAKPSVKKVQPEKIKQETEKNKTIQKQNSTSNDKPLKNDSSANVNVTNQENKAADYTKKDPIPFPSDMIIINPLDGDSSTNRLYKINYAAISKWAKPQGLNVKMDAPPVIDGVAFYTPDFFADFKVEGYDKNRGYKLYIDFVRFEGETAYINSILKIMGRDSSGKLYIIAEINRKILNEDKIFETLIPYELSYPGYFNIIVREYSDTPGKWGIWDMIITDKELEQIELTRPDASERLKEIEPKIFK